MEWIKNWLGTIIVAIVAGFVIWGMLYSQNALNDEPSEIDEASLESGEILEKALPTKTPVPTPLVKKSPTPTPALTINPTPIQTQTPVPTPEPTPFPTPSPSLNPTFTITPAPTPIPTPTPSPTPSPTPTPNSSPSPTPTSSLLPSNTNHIIISEIQLTGGTGKTTDDFIELYNPTNSQIDVSGWRLRKKTQSGTESSIRVFGSGKVIPARGFFLWANSSDGFASSLAADESSTAAIAVNNSVALLNWEGVVDAVAWGENLQNPFGEGSLISEVLEANQSYERKAWQGECVSAQGSNELLGNGCDTDNNAFNFEVRVISIPQNSQSQLEPY